MIQKHQFHDSKSAAKQIQSALLQTRTGNFRGASNDTTSLYPNLCKSDGRALYVAFVIEVALHHRDWGQPLNKVIEEVKDVITEEEKVNCLVRAYARTLSNQDFQLFWDNYNKGGDTSEKYVKEASDAIKRLQTYKNNLSFSDYENLSNLCPLSIDQEKLSSVPNPLKTAKAKTALFPTENEEAVIPVVKIQSNAAEPSQESPVNEYPNSGKAMASPNGTSTAPIASSVQNVQKADTSAVFGANLSQLLKNERK